MLASTLGRHVHDRAFKELEQPLLHAFAAYVACNRGVVALAGDFVDFVDKNDAALGAGHVVVGHLKQACEEAFDILANIAGLGQNRGVDNRERHVEHPCDGFGQKGLARSGGPHEHYVALLDVDVVGGLAQAFVVVVDRHGEIALGGVLPDYVLVEMGNDIFRLRQFAEVKFWEFFLFAVRIESAEVIQQLVDIVGAFGAEKYVAAYTGWNHHFAVGRRPAAERAAFFFLFCHLSV